METLLNHQADAIDRLNRVTINYRKVSKHRKTIEYLRKKILELSEWPTEFVTVNNELQQYEAMFDQPYFIERKYDEATEVYTQLMNGLKSALDRLEATMSSIQFNSESSGTSKRGK